MEGMGERIRELRKTHKLTQEQFSKQIGVARPQISKVENGKEGLSKPAVKLICVLYGISEEWLTGKAG